MSRTVLGYRIQFALFVPVAGTGMEHPCTPDVIPNTEYLWCLVVERASDARSSMDLRTACVSRRLRLYLIRRDYVLLCYVYHYSSAGHLLILRKRALRKAG